MAEACDCGSGLATAVCLPVDRTRLKSLEQLLNSSVFEPKSMDSPPRLESLGDFLLPVCLQLCAPTPLTDGWRRGLGSGSLTWELHRTPQELGDAHSAEWRKQRGARTGCFVRQV